MSGIDDLFDAASDLLEVCKDALVTTRDGVPDRCYVSPGAPAWDSEQLTVHVGSPAVGDTYPLQPSLAPGHRVAVQGQVNLVGLTITVVRGVPYVDDVGNLPSDDDCDESSKQMLQDLWAIWAYVKCAKRTGQLFAPENTRELFYDPAISQVAAGGLGGWVIPFRVQMNGYIPEAFAGLL